MLPETRRDKSRYYDPLGKNKLSHGFVPSWAIVAKRVKGSNESFAGESEGNIPEFLFNPFKSALL